MLLFRLSTLGALLTARSARISPLKLFFDFMNLIKHLPGFYIKVLLELILTYIVICHINSLIPQYNYFSDFTKLFLTLNYISVLYNIYFTHGFFLLKIFHTKCSNYK